MTDPSNRVRCFVLAAASLAAAGCAQELVPRIKPHELCEHFRSEPWPEGASVQDEERRAWIAEQLNLYCKGADQTLRQPKARRV